MYLESDPYSTRAQVIMLLLATMNDLKGGHSKSSVIAEIESRSWFNRLPEDDNPYSSSRTGEARWKTLVAFSRKDCYEEELFTRDDIRDSWQISKRGNECYVIRKSQFKARELDCRKCYMWSSAFKLFIDPNYEQSPEDAERPSTIYDDYKKRDEMIRVRKFWERYCPNPEK
jgi:hypothetical protein